MKLFLPKAGVNYARFVPGSSYYHFVRVKQNPVITSPLQLLMICSGYERKSVMIKLETLCISSCFPDKHMVVGVMDK